MALGTRQGHQRGEHRLEMLAGLAHPASHEHPARAAALKASLVLSATVVHGNDIHLAAVGIGDLDAVGVGLVVGEG